MKSAAYRAVKAAIAKGILMRPEICSKCLSKPRPTSDGRAPIQAHHADYSKPLEVEWICAKCHRKETPLPEKIGAPAFGEVNGQAKLTLEKAGEIKASQLGCRRLARIYGVHKATIQRVRNGTHWIAAAPALGEGEK